MNESSGNAVDHVIVSQASRENANKSPDRRIEEWDKEWAKLVKNKDALQQKLSEEYGKSAFMRAQGAVRKSTYDPQVSITKWVDTRSQMERDRAKILKEIHIIEQRLADIKDKRHQASQKAETIDAWKTPVVQMLSAVLDELRTISKLLTKDQS